MLIDLGELSGGMGKIFIREFMKTADYLSCDKGHILFREGERTHHFYTLIQGEFLLTLGSKKQYVYRVCNPGDLFGWSSLVGRTTYSASAVSTRLSQALRFDSDVLTSLLARYPDSGLVFFKKLAGMLGNRLLEYYRLMQGNRVAGNDYPEVENLHTPQQL